MGHLRANIWKTEDGETLGSLGMVEENRGGGRRRAVKQTCLPPAPRSPSVPSATCAGNVNVPPVMAARRRGVVRFGSPDPDPSALLPYKLQLHLATVKHESADELT